MKNQSWLEDIIGLKKRVVLATGIVFIVFLSIFLTPAQAEVSKGLEVDHPHVQSQKRFWIKVFTEHDDQSTLLHDTNFPEIVYKVVQHQNYRHHARIKKVRKELRTLRARLKRIAQKKGRNLTAAEKRVYNKIPLAYRGNLWRRAKNVRYQQGMSNRVKRGIERSNKYLTYIRKAFKSRNIPEDLAYLPHVESSFNDKAYSRVGAAGIWQFMPRSGKTYKLKIRNGIDERLDPLKATLAAGWMLKDNHRILKRRWPLAVTAYNHGPYSIKRAIKRVGSLELPQIIKKYKHRSFSFASKNFYASFLAAIHVAKNAKKYYQNLNLEPEFKFQTVKLKKAIRANKLLNTLKLTRKSFREYNYFVTNRAFKHNFYIPKGTEIRLPVELKGSVKSAIQKYAQFLGQNRLPRLADLFEIALPWMAATQNS